MSVRSIRTFGRFADVTSSVLFLAASLGIVGAALIGA
jgi:hypothetical protein